MEKTLLLILILVVNISTISITYWLEKIYKLLKTNKVEK
jgi:hypothetical protein